MSRRFPGRRFSFRRLLIAIIVVVLLTVGAFVMVAYEVQSLKVLRAPWTGGYVDVTETPSYEFESRMGSGQKNIVLAFIVAEGENCRASWGNYYTLDAADAQLDLDRRIAQVNQSGRDVVLSYGGRDNLDLASTCGNAEDLATAMAEPLERYDLNTIDLDIEGDDLTDIPSRLLRAEAISLLQNRAVEKGQELAVWVTVPADRKGLTNEALATIESFHQAGVTLAGVNLMTMNFGVPSTEVSSSQLSADALQAAHGQLYRSILATGRVVTPAQVWTMLGATPMIGQNDLPGEVFSIDDAVKLHRFGQENNLGRISFWSLNRDRQCDANYTDWQIAVNFCSGVNQDLLEFDGILSSSRDGSAHQPLLEATPPTFTPLPPVESTEDDPETSPYPIWNSQTTYLPNDRVVWQHNVYLALWTNTDMKPSRADATGQTAWRLVGPVLPGETPRPLPVLPEGTYPQWDGSTIYDTGDRVVYDGVNYEAKWWTQGDSPAADTAESPWRPLTEAEILEVLGES